MGGDDPDPVFLLRDARPLIRDGDDVQELLADIGGDGELGILGVQGCGPEQGVGPLLGPGGGLEVRVIVLLQGIDAELQQVPVQGFLQDTVVRGIPTDGTGPADGDGDGVLAGEDTVVRAVGVRARLAGQGVLGVGELAPK